MKSFGELLITLIEKDLNEGEVFKIKANSKFDMDFLNQDIPSLETLTPLEDWEVDDILND